jgi:hypothetical protein
MFSSGPQASRLASATMSDSLSVNPSNDDLNAKIVTGVEQVFDEFGGEHFIGGDVPCLTVAQ